MWKYMSTNNGAAAYANMKIVNNKTLRWQVFHIFQKKVLKDTPIPFHLEQHSIFHDLSHTYATKDSCFLRNMIQI